MLALDLIDTITRCQKSGASDHEAVITEIKLTHRLNPQRGHREDSLGEPVEEKLVNGERISYVTGQWGPEEGEGEQEEVLPEKWWGIMSQRVSFDSAVVAVERAARGNQEPLSAALTLTAENVLEGLTNHIAGGLWDYMQATLAMELFLAHCFPDLPRESFLCNSLQILVFLWDHNTYENFTGGSTGSPGLRTFSDLENFAQIISQ